ncbi:MAG: hypothetical protein E7142_06605 [Rikenellaceae bacterium]|nr:hypothetical protein [Rikenellaceae bacterium]
MKYCKYLLLSILIIAASCQKEDAYNGNDGEGGFSLAIKMDDSKTVATRADSTESPLTEEELRAGASVKIYKPAYQGLIREYTYGSMPDVVYLPASTAKYRVDVAAGEIVNDNPRKANFVQKSYKGTAEFSVTAGEVTSNVAVTAKICNAITNATFDSTIAENFKEGYTLTFALKENAEDADKLVYTANESGKDGYFIIDNALIEKSLYWTYVGELNDGTAFTKSGVIEPKDSEGNAVSLAGAKMTMNFKYTVKDGFVLFDLQVNETISAEDTKQDIIGWAPVSTGIIPLVEGDPNIWAKFVTVSADVDTGAYDADKVYFQYRKQGDTEWSAISDNIKAAATAKEGVYSAVLKGLEPNTQYEYQLVLFTKETTTTNDAGETVTVSAVQSVIGDENGDGSADEPATFTTGNDRQTPNASFEYVSTEGKCNVFYKNDSSVPEESRTKWWDSGNKSATDFNQPNMTYQVSDGKVGAAVCLESKSALGIIAAGNLYSGEMYDARVLPSVSGVVNFGRPFAARPTALRLWVKYTGATGEASDNLKEGKDEGQIKIAMGCWDKDVYGKDKDGEVVGDNNSPVTFDTAKSSTIIDFANDTKGGTLAYGTAIFKSNGDGYINESSTAVNCSGWTQITIPIEYFDTETEVTHIIISCAASRFGDYFEGYAGSKMWVDEVELLYDYDYFVTK